MCSLALCYAMPQAAQRQRECLNSTTGDTWSTPARQHAARHEFDQCATQSHVAGAHVARVRSARSGTTASSACKPSEQPNTHSQCTFTLLLRAAWQVVMAHKTGRATCVAPRVCADLQGARTLVIIWCCAASALLAAFRSMQSNTGIRRCRSLASRCVATKADC